MITKEQIEGLKLVLENYSNPPYQIGICENLMVHNHRIKEYPEMQAEINELIAERQKMSDFEIAYAWPALDGNAAYNFQPRINFLKKWIDYYERQLKPKRKAK